MIDKHVFNVYPSQFQTCFSECCWRVIRICRGLLFFFFLKWLASSSRLTWHRAYRSCCTLSEIRLASIESCQLFRPVRLPKDGVLHYERLKMTKPRLFLGQSALATKRRSSARLNLSITRLDKNLPCTEKPTFLRGYTSVSSAIPKFWTPWRRSLNLQIADVS